MVLVKSQSTAIGIAENIFNVQLMRADQCRQFGFEGTRTRIARCPRMARSLPSPAAHTEVAADYCRYRPSAQDLCMRGPSPFKSE